MQTIGEGLKERKWNEALRGKEKNVNKTVEGRKNERRAKNTRSVWFKNETQ